VVLYGCETWYLTLRKEHRLRRIFGPKRDEVTASWRKRHNEELHSLNSSPSIITMIKSRMMMLAGHVARMGEKKNAYRILVGKPESKSHGVDQNVNGWPILKWILERFDGMVSIALIWLRIGTSGGLL
jgi:hypothetical protein